MSGIRTLADVERIERTPLVERVLPGTPTEVFVRSAQRWLDSEALRYVLTGGRAMPVWRWTYAKLCAAFEGAARLFQDLRVTATDVVSIVLPNVPEAVFAFWGAQSVAVAHAVNPLLEVSGLEVSGLEVSGLEVSGLAAKRKSVVALASAGAMARNVTSADARVTSVQAVIEVNPRWYGPLPVRLLAWLGEKRGVRQGRRLWPRRLPGATRRPLRSSVRAAPRAPRSSRS